MLRQIRAIQLQLHNLDRKSDKAKTQAEKEEHSIEKQVTVLEQERIAMSARSAYYAKKQQKNKVNDE